MEWVIKLFNFRKAKESDKESRADIITRNAEIESAIFMIDNNMKKQGIEILKKHS